MAAIGGFLINQYTPPCDITAFQRELDRLTAGRSLSLRCVWGPTRVKAQIVDGGDWRVYMEYPLLNGNFISERVGSQFRRTVGEGSIVTGYRTASGVIVGDVLPTDREYVKTELEMPAQHLWIVEQRVRDDIARENWEAKCEKSRAKLRCNIFGDFPAEGVWDYYCEISEHRDGCCDLADELRVRCWGLYREPDARDLLYIAEMIQQRESRARGSMAQEQWVTDRVDAVLKEKQRTSDELSQMGHEMDRLAFRAVTRNYVNIFHDRRFREKRKRN